MRRTSIVQPIDEATLIELTQDAIVDQFLALEPDVLMGGGAQYFLPKGVPGGKRTDGRNLVDELVAGGYTYVADKAGLTAIDPTRVTRAVGLFNLSHLNYELDRGPTAEPSLAEMTTKAIDILSRNQGGYFLMVEGGRIDHALHATNAIRAVTDAVAFDDAIQAALDKVDLANTLIVVTADHDHTMVINGYSRRAGPTTPTSAGILGVVKDIVTGEPSRDAENMPYSVLSFGNGENRVAGARSTMPPLTDDVASAPGYHQEAGVKMGLESETHGGGDIMLMASGAGATRFKGTMVNTRVFALVKQALGF